MLVTIPVASYVALRVGDYGPLFDDATVQPELFAAGTILDLMCVNHDFFNQNDADGVLIKVTLHRDLEDAMKDPFVIRGCSIMLSTYLDDDVDR